MKCVGLKFLLLYHLLATQFAHLLDDSSNSWWKGGRKKKQSGDEKERKWEEMRSSDSRGRKRGRGKGEQLGGNKRRKHTAGKDSHVATTSGSGGRRKKSGRAKKSKAATQSKSTQKRPKLRSRNSRSKRT